MSSIVPDKSRTPMGREKANGFAQQNEMFKRQTEAVDAQVYGPMPVYSENADGWITRIRARMAPRIMARTGLAPKNENLKNILHDIMTRLEEYDQMGDEDAAFKWCHKETRAYVHRRRVARDNAKREVADIAEIHEHGKSRGLTESEVASVLVTTPRGLNYKERCKGEIESKSKLWQREQRTAPPVAPEPSELDSAFLRISIGDYLALDKEQRPKVQYAGEDVKSVYLDSSYDDDKHYVILLDSYGAASKLATTLMVIIEPKETSQADNDRTDELNAKLNAIAAEQSGDELTRPDDGYETIKENEAWASFWQSAANLSGLKGAPLHEHVHYFFNVGSVKVTGKNRGEMLTELKAHFDEIKNAPEDTQNNPPAIGVHEMTNDATNAQNSSEKPVSTTALPEAPFSANFHLWDKHGIDIQFTIRADTVNEGCKKVDATIEQRLSVGYAITRPTAQAPVAPSQPSNVTQMTTPTQTTANSGPTQNAKPVQSETIVKVVREADAKSKVVYTGLYTMFGASPGKYATYKIKDTDTGRLNQINTLTGMNWATEQLFTERAVDIIANYTNSDKVNAGGTPYHDLVSLQSSASQSGVMIA